MRILDTDKHISEKLDIKPIKKSVLKSGVDKIYNGIPKLMLKTGDIVKSVFQDLNSYDIVVRERIVLRVFVSKNDFEKLGVSYNIRNTEGLLLHFSHTDKELFKTPIEQYSNQLQRRRIHGFEYVSDIFHSSNELTNKEIYDRIFHPDLSGYDCIWHLPTRLVDVIGEKLDIKPITKTRLAELTLTPKDKIRTGDIIVERSANSNGDIKYTSIYISGDDFVKYDYGSILNLQLIGIPDYIKKEGVAVKYYQANSFLYIPFLAFNDNLERVNMHRVTEYVLRNDIKQPLPMEYFKNPPTHNAEVVYEREDCLPFSRHTKI